MQALRLDIAGDLWAIFLDDAHDQATDTAAVKVVLAGISDEEKVHMAEFITLMSHLGPRKAERILKVIVAKCVDGPLWIAGDHADSREEAGVDISLADIPR